MSLDDATNQMLAVLDGWRNESLGTNDALILLANIIDDLEVNQ